MLLIALGVGSCIAAPAVARAASIRVTAPVEAVGVGDEFLLAVRVTPDPNQPIDAVQAYLDFDANAIEILELIPQAPLSTVLRSVVDNAGGTADFTAGSLTSLPAAEFTLVTLRVRAVGETAATQISLHAALPRASNATRQGAFLNPELVDASFPVAAVGTPVAVVAVAPAGPLLVGELMDIDIQVRAGARLIDGAAVSLDFDPAIAQVVSITAGAALPTVLANRIDNAGGQIDFAAGAFSNWPSETFQLCRIQFRGMAPGTTTILSSTVLSRPTQVTFAGRSLPLEFRAAAITVQPAAQSANLVLEPSATSVSAGDVFEVRVVVHSGTQPIDGAAAFVDFDSTVLQVLSITPGIPLSTPILNHFDNQLGRVDIAAGQLTALPSQDITVATIRFQALGGAPQTTLALAVEPPRQSDVTYAGASILADLEGATIEIGSTDPRVTLEIVSEAPAPSVGDSFDLIVRVR
ncbi:MAG TPA: cohesin domain-containing protein, partial [Terriglobales bacterium]|nr:cohesin domain-containing protein [Terriglobales bacterium]